MVTLLVLTDACWTAVIVDCNEVAVEVIIVGVDDDAVGVDAEKETIIICKNNALIEIN